MVTNRIMLEEINVSHAPELYKIWTTPEVIEYTNIASMESIDDAIAMIQFLRELMSENKASRYTIILKESKEVIGSCGFNDFDQLYEIGYELSNHHWRQGYAFEALSILLEMNAPLRIVSAVVEKDNYASQKLLEKLGFRQLDALTSEGQLMFQRREDTK